MRVSLTAIICSLILGLSIGGGLSLANKAHSSRVVYVQDTRADRRLQIIMFNSYWLCKTLTPKFDDGSQPCQNSY